MSDKYEFIIKYRGKKASALQPGLTPHTDVCFLFKNDLTALGVQLPKSENVHLRGSGTVSLTFSWDPKDQRNYEQYRRYRKVVENQDSDMNILQTKSRRSIVSIFIVREGFHIDEETFGGDKLALQQHRLTFVYGGEKADGLIPGRLTHREACTIFCEDIKALGLWAPKDECIFFTDPGSIFCTFRWKVHGDKRRSPYAAVVGKQDHDSNISAIKIERSIHLILLNAMNDTPVLLLRQSGAISDTRKHSLESLPLLHPFEHATEERSAKRMKSDSDKPMDRNTSTTDATVSTLVKIEPNDDGHLVALLRPPATPVEPKPLSLPQNSSQISQLTWDLWNIRKEIAAAQTREISLERELQQLTSSRVSQPEAAHSDTTQERARRIDADIRISATQYMMDVDREKRIIAEKRLSGIKTECREPFVTPALFEAFLQISQLTTAVTDRVRTDERY